MLKDQNTQSIQIHAFSSLDLIFQEITRRILAISADSINAKGTFHLALTGGRTAEKLYKQIANSVENYDGWEFWFGDERNLSFDHEDRNSTMASQALFGDSQPPSSFHLVPYHQDSAIAAKQVHEKLMERKAVPFDLTLLSVGEDGHIASLFPGRSYDNTKLVIPVENSPKPPPSRVSLTASALSNTQNMIVMGTGEGKKKVLSDWVSGVDQNGPLKTLNPQNGINLFTDQEI